MTAPKSAAKSRKRNLAAAPAKPQPTPKPETDWVGIELAYTTTARYLNDIGREFGVSAGRICQKAGEMGWKRGALADRVRAKAEAKVAAQDAHAAQVQAGTEDAVEASAVLMANTILRERRDVVRLVDIAQTLMTKLEVSAADKKPAGRPAKDAPKPEPLAAQIDNLRKLGDTVTRLITLERTVLGITEATPVDPTKRVEEAVASGFDALRRKFNERLGKAG